MPDALADTRNDPLSAGGIGGAMEGFERESAPIRAEQARAASQPLPRQPKMERAPEPPSANIGNDAMMWLAAATALGGIAGALTRRHTTNALAAFTGTLEGLKEGNQQKFENNYKTWEAQSRQVKENNDAALAEYKQALERRDLDERQRSIQVQIIANKYRDGFMAGVAKHAAESGDFSMLAVAFDSVVGQQQQFSQSMTRLAERAQARRDRLEQMKIAQQDRIELEAERHQNRLGEIEARQGGGALPVPSPQPRLDPQDPQDDGRRMPQIDPRFRDVNAPGRARFMNVGGEGGAPIAERPIEYFDDATMNLAQRWIDRGGDDSVFRGALGYGAAANQRRQQLQRAITAIMTRDGITNEQLIARKNSYRAIGNTINKLEQQEQMVEAFTNKALRDARNLLDIAKKVDATGVPVFERWIRAGRRAAGDPDTQEFALQWQLTSNEFARIVSNPNLTGVMTDSARHEMAEAFPQAQNVPQLERSIQRLEIDSQNRRDALNDQISRAYERLPPLGRPKEKPKPDAPPSAPKEFKGRTATNPKTGEKMREIAPNEWEKVLNAASP